MDDTTKLAIALNDRARARSTGRAIQRKQAEEKRSRVGSATYVSYNADTEKCTVKTSTGELLEATYISNSGAAPGDKVAFSRGNGGAFVKAISR